MSGVSSLGLLTQSILQIQNVQQQLSGLSQQLSTGKKSLDLSDYSLNDSNNILNLNSLMAKKQSFANAINTVEPQVKLYDTALSSLSDIANQATTLINQATDPSQATSAAADAQFKGMLDQVQYYLNQQVGDRYIFGGTRYGTKPVADLTALSAPTTTAPVTSPTLPEYDTAAPGSDATAYTKDSLKIDDGFTLTYGVTSNDPAFQNLIQGLRWAYNATQQTDPTAFNTSMANARTLMAGAISKIQSVHGQVASNLSQLQATADQHNTFISAAQGQIDDIQTADPAKVATQISFATSQLQASYSVTAKIASLSLVNYLS